MAYESVKNQIDAYIKANGVNLITGPVLNAVLTTMLDELGEGYAFQGVLDTTDTPSPAADIPQAWLASAGTYLGGSITVDEGELALIIHTSDGWSKETVYRGVQLSYEAIVAALGYTPADDADLAEKQDTIADLSDIRSGAALGETSVQPVDIENMVEAEPIGSIVPPVNPSQFATKEEVSQLNQYLTGLPSVEIDLSDYPLVNGYLEEAQPQYITAGNYGIYHRCKFVPIDAYHGRTIRIVHNPQETHPVKLAVLQSMPDVSAQYSSLVLADGFDSVIFITEENSPYDFVIPENANYICFYIRDTRYSWDATPKSTTILEENGMFYTKQETDSLVDGVGKYGVKWSVSDINDLGSREFSAIGKTATIGIGNIDGNSDFDNIWPWAGIKRCNIKSNANGASVVTFEGETGFSIDGSNGDVFVRIPKFKTDHYVKDGYEHIVIGDGYVHPAFIEDGEELDEIFIGAFEASGDSSALFSRGGVIPANNITGASFLAGAKARGTKYSLYDMRCVDALWRLMAVEYGCRNSNRIFGWGYANFMQPDNLSHLKVVVAAQNTNTITLAQPSLNSIRIELLQNFASGNNLCICENTQENIIAQRKIVSVECASTADNVVITFEGDPINVNTDMFVGNAPCDCNYCETIGESWKLNWHTGRANRPVLLGIGYIAETCNPCRYRWVENPVGNVWHSLPDVTFKDLQMYVCKNMKDYEMLRYTPPYNPVGAILQEQNSNGTKLDVNTSAQPNYWITSLMLDIFAKGNNFGKSFDTAHDGTITSTKGFGGYYYLYDGTHYIANGGGYDHLWRCNMLTNRAWQSEDSRWYLYGARLMFKNI